MSAVINMIPVAEEVIVVDPLTDPETDKKDQMILAEREAQYHQFLETEKPLVDQITREIISCVERTIRYSDTGSERITNIALVSELPTWKRNYLRNYINSPRLQQLVDESMTSQEKKRFLVDTSQFVFITHSKLKDVSQLKFTIHKKTETQVKNVNTNNEVNQSRNNICTLIWICCIMVISWFFVTRIINPLRNQLLPTKPT